MSSVRVAIVGGGIIGLATAREFLEREPGSEVVVFEKEDGLASHQTGRNSGVVHAGLYYQPGSLKARLCRRGVGLLRDFAQDKGVAYQECGKIVVAKDDVEGQRLREIHRKAQANGVSGVELIGASRIREIEPAASGNEALHSPETAIVDYKGVSEALGKDITAAGSEVRLREEVIDIRDVSGAEGAPKVRVTTQTDSEDFDIAIACAGLQSDRLARASGESPTPKVVPFFGDYYMLSDQQAQRVNGLIYPVPDPKYPFLGVHITRRVDGGVMLGPNAYLSLGREVYRRVGINLKDVAEVARYSGFWRFASQNIPATLRQTRTAISKRAFVNEAQRYMPEIQLAQVTRGPRGVRAQAMHTDGILADDFIITGSARVVHVRNAPSPAATGALAIAEHVVAESLSRAGLAKRHLTPEQNPDSCTDPEA